MEVAPNPSSDRFNVVLPGDAPSGTLSLVNALYGNSMKIDYTDIKDSEGKANGTRVVIYIPIIT